ncbi:speckle targeted PIP5K1A-regulated poly(A) polymerase-like [Tubulanus polymorphus]|uniref:speckle targeted PIP5K1A-regulated poly(A) polymerase-like n=1 Tax=Tubulanus polymorphus TaxID=672921 RepID=UPI003DA38EBB
MDFYCDLCNITVNSEAIMETHIRGKKHQKNVERSIQTAERSVYVRGFPKGHNADIILERYFEKFGTIEEIVVEATNQNFALVQYKNLGSACTALQQKRHYIGNHQLVLMPKKSTSSHVDRLGLTKNPSHSEAKQKPQIEDTTLNSRLINADSVNDQFGILVSELALPADNLELRQIVVDMLQGLFVQYFPGCQVVSYGSTATGLGFVGCDMDVFLDLKLYKAVRIEEAAQIPINFPYMKHIPAFRDMKRGYMTREELANISRIDQARLISKILVTVGKGITDVLTIPSVRCPIVRFVHQPTSQRIDLSFKSRLAVKNSQLIKLYCVLDARFKQLAFAIRYWARRQNLLGNMNAGWKLTNYALTLMLVFYLQDAQVLPTVKFLRDYAEDDDILEIDGWDCSFTSNVDNILPSGNTMSLEELLIGFFKFYSEFDFHNFLICPRDGLMIPVSKIPHQLPSRAAQNFKVGPINIQDPFALDHNTAQNVNDRMRNLVYHHCTTAHKDCLSAEFQKPVVNGDKLWGLRLLFVESEPLTEVHKPQQTHGKSNEHAFNIAMMPDKCPQFFMKIAMMQEVELNEGWLSYTTVAIKLLLEKVFMIKCRTLRCETSPDIPVEIDIKIDNPVTDKTSSGTAAARKTAAGATKRVADDSDAQIAKKAKIDDAADCSGSASSSETTAAQEISEAPHNSSAGPYEDGEIIPYAELMEPEFDDLTPAEESQWTARKDAQMALQCRLSHRIWQDRKNSARRINRKQYDPLSLEAKITKLIRESGECELRQCMQFIVEISYNIDPCSVLVVFRLETPECKGDFNTFQAFMKQMIPKLLTLM